MSYFWDNQKDNAPKITFLIWSPVGRFESSFGHVSIVVTRFNTDISYSLAPKGCDTEPLQEYFKKQTFRDGYAFKLKLTFEQAAKVACWFSVNFVQDGKHETCRYKLLTHNCVSPIKDAFMYAGIKLPGDAMLPVSFANLLWKNGLVDQFFKISGCIHRTYPFWSGVIYRNEHPWDQEFHQNIFNNCRK